MANLINHFFLYPGPFLRIALECLKILILVLIYRQPLSHQRITLCKSSRGRDSLNAFHLLGAG